jgi:hypothetical protein
MQPPTTNRKRPPSPSFLQVVRAFPLSRGRGDRAIDAGVFKGDFAVFDAEGGSDVNTKWDKLPPRENIEVVVRLYVEPSVNI